MNQFLKKVFIFFILLSSINLFAQEDVFGEKQENPFNPKFTLGSGLYTLTGDIQNEETGLLKGQSGFNAGMKFDLSKNLDLSFLFLKTSFSGSNDNDSFESDIDGFGLHLGYSVNQFFNQSKITPLFSLGAQKVNVRNDSENSSAIILPLGFGLRMNVSERLQFDIAMNFGIGMGDIDMSKENKDNADGYKSLNFTIHYDLFTPEKNVTADYLDDSYYADVDFVKLESEDEDGDLILDVDDYCPKTPIGVKVDDNGCPLDDDKDGIANYLDQQKNTIEGSIVDENGVRLTADKYHSMYSDYEAASRRYANFYNEVEIKREDYKTVDEYLIAKANAFNKAYNEGLNDDLEVRGLIYKVKIGEFKDGIPAKITNKLLSLNDLESFRMNDDAVIFAVGNYATLDEAMNRQYVIEEKGFDETYILVDNNGEISNYVASVSKPEIDEEEVVVAPDELADSLSNDNLVKEVEEPTNETIYRIQIGTFNKALSEAVFVGLNNVISFTGKDRLVRYMAGSFAEYKDAINYQAQMKARGFKDAFIVTYKNGERISLNIAIKNKNTTSIKEEILKLDFTVQIMVSEASVSAAELEKMSKLGNIEKEVKGSDMHEYYAGTYLTLEEANIRLEEAKLVGYTDAFIFVKLDGERITLQEAKELLK